MKLHSLVDVITNSSTVVYVWPNQDAIQKTKELLKEIVSVVGFEGDIDEYFDVDYTLDSDYIDIASERKGEEFDVILEQYLATTDIKSIDDFYNLPWAELKTHYAHLTEIVLGMWKDGQYDLGDDSMGYSNERYLMVVVTPKNQATFDLWRKIGGIFTVDAASNY